MIERTLNGDRMERLEKDIVLHFHGKRKVLSSSRLNGGLRSDLTAVFNHCDMDEELEDCPMYGATYREHLMHAASGAGLDPNVVSGLSTSVDMQYVVSEQETWKDFTVTAWVTGGILNNGRRIGDVATMEEREERFYLLEGEEAAYHSGTINILLHITANLSDNALVGAVMLVAEAKAAAIQEAGQSSCYSSELATGSGTDGVIVIADAESEIFLTQARSDIKLGECIGKAVKRAVRTALLWNVEIEKQKQERKKETYKQESINKNA